MKCRRWPEKFIICAFFLTSLPAGLRVLLLPACFRRVTKGLQSSKFSLSVLTFLRKPKALAFAAKVSRGGVTSRHFGANVVSGIGKLRVRTLCFLDAWLKSPTQRFVTFPIIRFLVSFAGVGRREYTVFGLSASFLN